MKKAFIFDLDGTIVDSERIAFLCWENGMAELGHTYTEEHNLSTIGQRLDKVFDYIIETFQLDMTPDQLSAFIDPFWEELVKDGVPPMKGAHELFDELKARGIPWAIATSSQYYWAEHKLRHLGRLDECALIISVDKVKQAKPHPECYLTAADQLGLDITECIAVEDSIVGYEAAVASGATTIAIPNESFSTEQYEQADYCYHSLLDILENLDELLNL